MQVCLSLEPPSQKYPTGHSEPAADDDPGAQKLPAAAVHGEQDEEFPPTASVWKVPAGQEHCELTDDSAGDVCPVGQGVHLFAPTPEYVPGGHEEHLLPSAGIFQSQQQLSELEVPPQGSSHVGD